MENANTVNPANIFSGVDLHYTRLEGGRADTTGYFNDHRKEKVKLQEEVDKAGKFGRRLGQISGVTAGTIGGKWAATGFIAQGELALSTGAVIAVHGTFMFAGGITLGTVGGLAADKYCRDRKLKCELEELKKKEQFKTWGSEQARKGREATYAPLRRNIDSEMERLNKVCANLRCAESNKFMYKPRCDREYHVFDQQLIAVYKPDAMGFIKVFGTRMRLDSLDTFPCRGLEIDGLRKRIVFVTELISGFYSNLFDGKQKTALRGFKAYLEMRLESKKAKLHNKIVTFMASVDSNEADLAITLQIEQHLSLIEVHDGIYPFAEPL